MERRLAAILSADAVGYSRLMAADELSTLKTLEAHRGTMAGLIKQHGGRVVDEVGDNLLAEFPSAVDAVQCAMVIQEQLAEANGEFDEARRMPFRIGVNVGDLMVVGERIVGDGVNVAARLEAEATPGGVAISGAVLEQVSGKLPMDVTNRGEFALKNVPRPVRIYEVSTPTDSTEGDQQPAHGIAMNVPGFGGHSAIAVLPFRNLSQSEDQEYFADGLTEDLTARLAALKVYPVISRNSSFAYKHKLEDSARAGRELGAHYVVTGSVRKAGDRIRVTSELEDSADGRQLWAGRFDRQLTDLFAVQDEITAAIAGALGPALFQSEMLHAIRRAPESLDAWDCAHRGLWHLYRYNRDDLVSARAWANRALELQADTAMAWCILAFCAMYEVIYHWTEDREAALLEAHHAAERAVALEPENPMALTALGFAMSMEGKHDRALSLLERAVTANPSSALAYWSLGSTLNVSGAPEEGIAMVEKAVRLSPQDPLMNEFLFTIASAQYRIGRFTEAAQYAQESLDLKPDQPGAWRILAVAQAELGHEAEAAAAIRQLRKLAPDFAPDSLRLFMQPELADRFIEGLHKAGWQE